MSNPLGPWTSTVNTLNYVTPGSRTVYDKTSKRTTTTAVANSSIQGTRIIRAGVGNKSPYKPSTYSFQKRVYVSGSLNAVIDTPTVHVTQSGYTDIPLYPALANLTSDSLSQAKSKLISASSAVFQGMVSAGEFGETAREVGHLVDLARGVHNISVKRFIKALKPSRQSARDVTKVASDLWLEYQFGIVPTIADISNFMTALDASVKKSGRVIKKSASYVQKNQSGSVIKDTYIGNCPVNRVFRSNGSYLAKVGCTYKTSPANPAIGWQENFGLSFADFVPSVYELLPYSWLLDYVTNAQDFISAASHHRGLINGSCWSLTLSEVSHRVITSPKSNSLYKLQSGNPAESSRIDTTFTRDVFDLDTFVPEFRFQVPSLAQAANVVALAASQILPSPKLPPGKTISSKRMALKTVFWDIY